MLIYEIINRQEFYVKAGCHPKDSLIIVLDGSFNCSIAGRFFNVNKNDIFVFGGKSQFERNVISPIKCIYIQFDAFPIPLKDGIMKISDMIRMKNTAAYLEQAIRDKNDSLVQHFVDDIFIMYQGSGNNRHIYDDNVILSCVDFFAESYSEAINLDTLSEKFNISKQWLISKFKKHTGRTPMEYLTEVRLGYGKAFLTDTDLTVGEIADKCGFENVYYFSNTFKKHVGVSPSGYREKFKL
ncbi:MAG: helix-turn-helix transcriptional regulator [Clostridia bacterium]|nr:helix-turn-helix transcriptional regulator [Clostridia bacterium]